MDEKYRSGTLTVHVTEVISGSIIKLSELSKILYLKDYQDSYRL